ncbi:MAG TPA: dihydropteroate synthase [Firmicutes bacterium]|nr:dihydropteroate synthase [Bacillota bacterium]
MDYGIRLLSGLRPADLIKEFERIRVSPEGIEIMKEKGDFILLKVDGLSAQAAAILKQEMLAKGGEAALGKDLAYLGSKEGAALLMGTKAQYRRLLSILPRQPFGLAQLAKELENIIEAAATPPPSLTVKGQEFHWGKRTYIMGIINLTPDSFSGDGLLNRRRLRDVVLAQADRFMAEGADILDVGAESTRPDGQQIPATEELNRLLPVLEVLAKESPLPISVDTYKAAVAAEALENGADIINDIWGLQGDPEMATVVAKYKAPVIVMHNQESCVYHDLMLEIAKFLYKSIEIAEEAGISKERVIIDPGIGFGKTVEDNLFVIERLHELKALGCPVLLGTSRKSVIGKTLNLPVTERVEGTAATVAAGIMRGADIIRVHDVKEMTRVARMTDAILRHRPVEAEHA